MNRYKNLLILNLMEKIDEDIGEQFELYKNNINEDIKNALIIYCKYLMATLNFLKNYNDIKDNYINMNDETKKTKKDNILKLYNYINDLSFQIIEKSEVLKTGDYLNLCNNVQNNKKVIDIFKNDIESGFLMDFNLLHETNNIYIFVASI